MPRFRQREFAAERPAAFARALPFLRAAAFSLACWRFFADAASRRQLRFQLLRR